MYVGIDYSSRRIAAAFLGGPEATFMPIVWESRADRSLTGFNATREVYSEFHRLATSTPVLLEANVYIEAPIAGGSGNRQTTVMMAIAAGTVWAACVNGGAASIDFVAPASWKKRVCGFGALDKQGVAEWLEDNHPALSAACLTEDARDAMCMALLAEQVHAGRTA